MKRTLRDYLSIVEAEAAPLGVTYKLEEQKGARHPKVTLHWEGRSRFLIITSSSTKDRRAMFNFRGDVKRELRTLKAMIDG